MAEHDFPFIPRHIGDPIWMEHILHDLEVELEVKQRYVAARLETVAAVHGAIAEGAAKAAKILGGGGARS